MLAKLQHLKFQQAAEKNIVYHKVDSKLLNGYRYAIPDVQTGKQLNVRGEVAHFYGSNKLSTAALLRFLTAWANWSNRASVLECSHVLASISQVKIGSQYSGIKVKRHETPKEYFKWFILCEDFMVS